jgi:MHS family proline/betaine transporter-like MFS transporter
MSIFKYKKTIASAIIGNILEWYDFILYAYFITIFSKIFFPHQNNFHTLLLTYSLFAASYLMRPLGALIFGFIGDRLGRKTSLYYSIAIMSISSFMLSALPDYNSWGVYSIILFIIIRLSQGLALGGEYSGAALYLIESAPPNYKTFFGSFALAGAYSGFILSSFVVTILSHLFSPANLESYGWRFGFLLGGFVGLVGFYIRSKLTETTEFQKAKLQSSTLVNPLKELYIHHWKNLSIALAVGILPAGLSYMVFVYFNNFLITHGNYTIQQTSSINFIMMLFVVFTIPLIGFLADKFLSRKIFMWTAAILITIFCIPLMHLLIDSPITVLLFFAFLNVLFEANLLTEIAEIFPVNCRYSGIAITLNLTNGLAGGLAPIIAIYLIHATGILISPMFYIILLGVISIAGMFLMKKIKRNTYV